MVYQIVYVSGFEFMEDGYGHCAICDGSEETYAPVGLVAGADCNFVTLFKTALLKGNVEFGNPQGHFTVCKRHTLVIGKGRTVPVTDEALLQCFVY